MASVGCRPLGSPEGHGDHTSPTTLEETVVRLIHPTVELVPGAPDRVAGRIGRRSGFGGTWTARRRWPPFPTPLREERLSGLPGAFAGVLRPRVGGGPRRPCDRSPQGLSDATKVRQPAYPRYNRGAGEGRCPFDPQQTRAPVDCAGGGVAPLPPVTALRDG